MSVVASTVEVAVSFSPTTTTTIAKSYVNYSSSSPRSRIPLDSAVDEPSANIADDEDDSLDMDAFKARKAKQEDELRQQQEVESDFDGYALRDAIYEKWGLCYDLDFNPVDSFGFRGLYLNVLPFHLGGRRFRHDTELDYLCHLQAIVEILQKYDQVRKGQPNRINLQTTML